MSYRQVLMFLFLALFICSSAVTKSYSLDASAIYLADQLREEKSYRLAQEKYQEILKSADLSATLVREIEFKFADCSWRSHNEDSLANAQKILQALIESQTHDLIWAQASESLAEFYLQQDQWSHTNEIKQYLENTRDFWAGQTDIPLARQHFIKVSFTLGDFITQNWGWYYNGITPISAVSEDAVIQLSPLGLHTLYEEILKVADSNEDKAKAIYSLAMCYLNQYTNDEEASLSEKYFNELIKEFPNNQWLDDAYYQLGQYYERHNDFVHALISYQNLLEHFKKGESKWFESAVSRIKEISSPQLQLSVGYTFLPNSEVQFNLNWRNLKDVQINFYKFDLVSELRLNPQKTSTDYDYGVESYPVLLKNLVDSKRYLSFPVALSFKKVLEDDGKHIWHRENKGLCDWQKKDVKDTFDLKKGILPAGTYLLVAQSAEILSYDLVLVTDLGLVVKTAGHSALFFSFDGKTGTPKAGVKVKYHYRYYDDNGQGKMEEGYGVSNDAGLLKVSLKASAHNNSNNQHNLFACASDAYGTMQAITQSNFYSEQNGKGAFWLYAFAGRPAYRPKETISFKGMVRQYDGNVFSTPSRMNVKARVYDPKGNQVKEAVYILNEFGSFSDRLTLDEKASLGEYRLDVWTDNGNRQVGNAVLFRLEEYKLPEFLVNMKAKPPEKRKQGNSYRLGDRIQIELDAQYYFGGAVPGAEVEYLIYQSPYNHIYYPQRNYDWYYSDLRSQSNYHDNGQLLTQGKIKTDRNGKASFSFPTPKDSANDLQYHIEARVVDQSRREIRSVRDIKVMRTAFLAYLNPKQNLYRPGDKAEINIKTINANDEPLSAEGKITVARNWWREPILARPPGAKIPQSRLEEISAGVTAQVREPGHYEENELFTRFVKTNERGETTFEFQPDQEGYYAINLSAFDSGGKEVKSSTVVYVADKQSKDIGYRYGGLQIITEKDTFVKGDVARVMLVSDQPDTWVLFTAETDEIHSDQMLHLEGPVKLIEVPITENFAPNVFFTAISAHDYQLKMHEQQIIVPPEEKFLNIRITSDKETYSPQEKGNFELEITDKNGRPVSAQIGLGMIDESVYAIQSDYAADIRQFFYGDKRAHNIQTQASFYQRPYTRLVRDEKNNLMTEDERISGAARQKLLSGTDGTEVNNELKEDSLFREGAIGGGRLQKDMAFKKGNRADETLESSINKAVLGSAVPKSGLGSPGELVAPQVRSDFRSTVFWQPDIVTDQNGKAKITVQFPDSLTTWRTTARAITSETSVGTIIHQVKTQKDLIVRLQAPRFFVERDQTTISANVHNYTGQEQKIKVTLQAKGLKLLSEESVGVTVPSNDEKRVDWKTLAQEAGDAQLTVMAQTEKNSDAVEKNFPVVAHGIEKFLAGSLVLKSAQPKMQSSEFMLELPQERIKKSTQLRLILSPSLAASMLDALPFLADYPYGCVEQTMSRFLPAVIVAKTMQDLGFSAADVKDYIEHVLEPRGDPPGHPERHQYESLSKLNKITQEGLKRLYDFQHPDGGWGWWKEGESDSFMSAYVLWGLSLARQAKMEVKSDVIFRAISYLQTQLVEEESNPDMLAWMLQALAVSKSKSKYEDIQTQRLWERRERLNPYTRSLFALSEFYRGNKEHAEILARNLSNGMQEDKDNKTVHWGESGIHYRFSEGGVEATALCLKALSNISPQSPDLSPAARWLVLNRRGASWKNTRDTAIAILGLADYLKTTSELTPEYDYEILVNGKSVRKGPVNPSNMFTFNRYLDLPDEALVDGKNQIQVKMSGKGSLNVSGYLKYFTLEEDISAAGHEIFVERQYFKEEKRPTLLKGYIFEWKTLHAGDQVKSGDRIRVELTLEAKNNYEYLMAEDYKPAGCEAVELKSGGGYADVLDKDGRETTEKTWVYQEFRDQKAVFFISKLKPGKHRIRYELRAEVPGEFHVMPNQVQAMYVPEIRANSKEMRLQIVDKND